MSNEKRPSKPSHLRAVKAGEVLPASPAEAAPASRTKRPRVPRKSPEEERREARQRERERIGKSVKDWGRTLHHVSEAWTKMHEAHVVWTSATEKDNSVAAHETLASLHQTWARVLDMYNRARETQRRLWEEEEPDSASGRAPKKKGARDEASKETDTD